MRLSARLTIAIAMPMLLLNGVYGGYLLSKEEQELRAVAKMESRLLGRSLQLAFEDALRDRQLADMGETIQAVSQIDPGVSIYVYDERDQLLRGTPGAPPLARLAALKAKMSDPDGKPYVEFWPERGAQVLQVIVPLRDELGRPRFALVMERPLVELRRDLEQTRRSNLSSVALSVLLQALVVFFVTRRYVGRAMAHMIEDMRRVRRGDLDPRREVYRRDEIGEAQHEFDALVVELAQARQQAQDEQDARRRIERGLQQADKLITLGQMSAAFAHEIGSPLQVMEGRARMLLRRSEEPDTRRSAEILVSQTERVARIVSQMLSSAQRRRAITREVRPDPLIGEVVELLAREAARREVTLRWEAGADAALRCDPDQLQQVALNLVRNALDATASGGHIAVRSSISEERFTLRVQDDGPGVAPAVAAQVFEPFFTTRAEQGGSGLGLAVVRTIAEEHGGSVALLPSERGACFEFWIPVRRASRPTEPDDAT
jgi:signal transduction histidine kinase